MHQLLYWLAVLFFVFAAVLIVASSRAAFILRARFPGVWEAEGRPVRWLYLGRALPKEHFFRFLDERRYLATGSPSYSRLCGAIRVGWYVFFLLFLGIFLGMFAVLLFRVAG